VRAAIAIESFRPGPGGVEGVAWALASELGRRGEELTVLCRTAAPDAPPGVSVARLGGPAFWQPLRVLEFSRRAGAAAREGGFEVVQTFSRTRHQDVYRAGGGSHAHYLESMYARPALRRWLSPRHRALLWLEESAFRDPRQVVVCNSRLVADELAARYAIGPERLRVIYNGVDLERFHPRERAGAGAALRRELGLAGPVALFVGSGFERKGLAQAIRALAEVRGQAVLLVAGAGEPAAYRREADRLGVGARVHFLGVRLDVARLYAAADLFVLPTRYDPFANACLEAMASGLPVATTRSNGAAELIAPGANGLLCDDDFTPAFRALEQPESLAPIGAAARATAERHSWGAHADAVLALWREVAARR
jgi:UDP-glucose:(heptosyl)LPS alpha-1,3-glucosyltransferase